jgi:hypothetical protein
MVTLVVLVVAKVMGAKEVVEVGSKEVLPVAVILQLTELQTEIMSM